MSNPTFPHAFNRLRLQLSSTTSWNMKLKKFSIPSLSASVYFTLSSGKATRFQRIPGSLFLISRTPKILLPSFVLSTRTNPQRHCRPQSLINSGGVNEHERSISLVLLLRITIESCFNVCLFSRYGSSFILCLRCKLAQRTSPLRRGVLSECVPTSGGADKLTSSSTLFTYFIYIHSPRHSSLASNLIHLIPSRTLVLVLSPRPC